MEKSFLCRIYKSWLSTGDKQEGRAPFEEKTPENWVFSCKGNSLIFFPNLPNRWYVELYTSIELRKIEETENQVISTEILLSLME